MDEWWIYDWMKYVRWMYEWQLFGWWTMDDGWIRYGWVTMTDGLMSGVKPSPSHYTDQLGLVDLRSGVCFGCNGDRSDFAPSKSSDGSGHVATVTASLYLSSLWVKPPFENSIDISSKLWSVRTIGALTLLTEPSGGLQSGACRDQKKILIWRSDSGFPLEYLPYRCLSDGSTQVRWDDFIWEVMPLAERC